MDNIRKISKEVIIKIHDDNIKQTGGSLGFLDEGLFEYLCEKPFQIVFGVEACLDLYDKAIEFLFGFAQHQVFVDGNKRTGIAVMLIFLFYNDISLNISYETLYDLTLKVANNKISKEDVKLIIKNHTK